jgi:hypothetical protein
MTFKIKWNGQWVDLAMFSGQLGTKEITIPMWNLSDSIWTQEDGVYQCLLPVEEINENFSVIALLNYS